MKPIESVYILKFVPAHLGIFYRDVPLRTNWQN